MVTTEWKPAENIQKRKYKEYKWSNHNGGDQNKKKGTEELQIQPEHNEQNYV